MDAHALHDLQITAKEYLETALQLVPGEGQSIKSKNEIRTSIKCVAHLGFVLALLRSQLAHFICALGRLYGNVVSLEKDHVHT